MDHDEQVSMLCEGEILRELEAQMLEELAAQSGNVAQSEPQTESKQTHQPQTESAKTQSSPQTESKQDTRQPHTECAKTQSEPQTESKQMQAQTESAKTQPDAQTELQTHQLQTESAKTQSEPQTEPKQTDQPQTESAKTQSELQTESKQTHQPQTESAKTQSELQTESKQDTCQPKPDHEPKQIHSAPQISQSLDSQQSQAPVQVFDSPEAAAARKFMEAIASFAPAGPEQRALLRPGTVDFDLLVQAFQKSQAAPPSSNKNPEETETSQEPENTGSVKGPEEIKPSDPKPETTPEGAPRAAYSDSVDNLVDAEKSIQDPKFASCMYIWLTL